VSPLLATQLDVSRVLGLVTFDCHPGSPFFLTSETHIVIARLCLLLPTPLALSSQMATPILTTTLTLSLSPQKVTRLICVLRCPRWPVPSPPPAARALRIVLNFCPQKARAAAGRLAMCVTAKGASRRRPRHPPRCRLDSDIASDPPPRGRAHLVESPHQGGN
jgi:hypothetical protein